MTGYRLRRPPRPPRFSRSDRPFGGGSRARLRVGSLVPVAPDATPRDGVWCRIWCSPPLSTPPSGQLPASAQETKKMATTFAPMARVEARHGHRAVEGLSPLKRFEVEARVRVRASITGGGPHGCGHHDRHCHYCWSSAGLPRSRVAAAWHGRSNSWQSIRLARAGIRFGQPATLGRGAVHPAHCERRPKPAPPNSEQSAGRTATRPSSVVGVRTGATTAWVHLAGRPAAEVVRRAAPGADYVITELAVNGQQAARAIATQNALLRSGVQTWRYLGPNCTTTAVQVLRSGGVVVPAWSVSPGLLHLGVRAATRTTTLARESAFW
jgi:hypothetical protein